MSLARKEECTALGGAEWLVVSFSWTNEVGLQGKAGQMVDGFAGYDENRGLFLLLLMINHQRIWGGMMGFNNRK